MKKQLLTAVAVTALMAVPSLASAGEQGWYVRGNVGYGVLSDMNLTGDISGKTGSEGNIAGSLGLGYDFGNNWRVELDGAQLWNDLGAIGGSANTSASSRLRTGMVNVIYDFSDFGAFSPYVGLGLGLSQSRLSAFAYRTVAGGVFTNNVQCPSASSCLISESKDEAVAWQVLAGLGYEISDSLVWDTQYRYVNTGELSYSGLGGPTHASVVPGGSGGVISSASGGSEAHVVMTGFRYRFGGNGSRRVETTKYRTEYAAPVASMYACADGSSASSLASCVAEPIAQPMLTCWDGSMVSDRSACSLPPAPPVETIQTITQYDPCDVGATSFVVYFPWDKSTLTEQARNVIIDAANTAKQCNISNLIIEGHADSSGALGYNVGLSNRRANVVEMELKANGVSTSNVVKSAKGEVALAMPTGDGVREPLNRRTEVLIQLVPGTYLTQ